VNSQMALDGTRDRMVCVSWRVRMRMTCGAFMSIQHTHSLSWWRAKGGGQEAITAQARAVGQQQGPVVVLVSVVVALVVQYSAHTLSLVQRRVVSLLLVQ